MDKIDTVVNHCQKFGFKNIITMVGAGISTSAGIPDFRSVDTGLYNNLQKYNLPYPSAIFELDYMIANPEPFFDLVKCFYTNTYRPTPCHYFIRLLHEKGLLLRHYTQNVDTLERVAGIPAEKLVEAHGTFYTNHCLGCRKEYALEWMKGKVLQDLTPTCTECCQLVKPDVVLFNETLPDKFYELQSKDFEKCDLLIIMGTLLKVEPFASLIDRVNDSCFRLSINREDIYEKGKSFNSTRNQRDIWWAGDCDDGALYLAEAFGLKDELKELVDDVL